MKGMHTVHMLMVDGFGGKKVHSLYWTVESAAAARRKLDDVVNRGGVEMVRTWVIPKGIEAEEE